MSQIERIKRSGVIASSIAVLIMSGCVRGESNNPEPASDPGDNQPVAASGVSPASPRVVCEHVVALMDAELGEEGDDISAAELEQFVDECTQEATAERATIGDAAFANQANCVLQANSVEGLKQCDDGSEPPAAAARSAEQLALDLSICTHVLEVMQQEMQQGESGATISAADIERYTTQCVADIGEERVMVGDAEFMKQANCVLAASTVEMLSACDPNPAP